MKLFKRVTLPALSLVMVLGLAACDVLGASRPDMPMEFTIDGHQVALGRTTAAEMAGWGWKLDFTGIQSEIREDAKYVACYYAVNKDRARSDSQFWVSVWVPFQKNLVGDDRVDLSGEQKMSKTEGIVCRVEIRKDASENFEILYNGINYQDMTWEDAAGWGAAEKEGAYPTTYELAAAQGTLRFEKGYTGRDEPGKFTVSMNADAFSRLQK